MKTYLIPTDFSKTANNAALYTAKLTKHLKNARIILLNSCYISIYESILPSADFVLLTEEGIMEKVHDRTSHLNSLKNELCEMVPEHVKIDTHLSRQPLTRAILDLIKSEKVDFVILGSNGIGLDEDSEIGANVISISKTSPVPVVVVPPNSTFESLKRVVLACDFKKVTETIPLNTLKRILEKSPIELLVVNIDPHGKHYQWNPELIAEETALYKMLECFHPKYFYSDHPDTITGIIDFATKYDAQLIIALPKKYSFLQALVHSSITQKLTIQSSLPVLILKDDMDGFSF